MAKKKFPEPNDTERLQYFLLYCDELIAHPFFQSELKGSGDRTINFNFSEESSVVLSFDEYHFESFLIRLRQYFFYNELYHHDNLEKSINNLLGNDGALDDFFTKIKNFTNNPQPQDHLMTVFKGQDLKLIEGYSFREIMEAKLYTGLIHSERRINAEEGSSSYGLGNPHIAVSKYLTYWLSNASSSAVQNILNTRMQILRIAKKKDKIDLIPGLKNFDEEVKKR